MSKTNLQQFVRPLAMGVLLAAAGLISFGIGVAAQENSSTLVGRGVQERTYNFKEASDKKQTYCIYVPSTYDKDKKTPLIVALHGLGLNPRAMLGERNFVDQAERRGYIVVAPYGYNAGAWYGARGMGAVGGFGGGVVGRGGARGGGDRGAAALPEPATDFAPLAKATAEHAAVADRVAQDKAAAEKGAAERAAAHTAVKDNDQVSQKPDGGKDATAPTPARGGVAGRGAAGGRGAGGLAGRGGLLGGLGTPDADGNFTINGLNIGAMDDLPGMLSALSGTGNPPNVGALSEQDVLNVLEIVRKEYNIDPDRTYLMGHSMGGGGALYLGVKYKDNWAALAPFAPAASTQPDSLENIKDMPIIMVQGDLDQFVPIAGTRRWAAKMKDLGMQHEYVEVAGADHMNILGAYLPQMFDFFDKHTRAERKQDDKK